MGEEGRIHMLCFLEYCTHFSFYLQLQCIIENSGPSGAIATPVSDQSIHLICNRYMLLCIINKTSMFSNQRFFSCFFLLVLIQTSCGPDACAD